MNSNPTINAVRALRDAISVESTQISEGRAILLEPTSAIRQAFQDPIHFPPIHQAIYQGDTVAIALEAATPCLDALVLGIMQSLLNLEILPTDITLLLAQGNPSVVEAISKTLVQVGAEDTNLVEFDPTEEAACSYLGDAEKVPAFVATPLSDSDVVITVGVVRPLGSIGGHGVHAAFYPTFAHLEAQERYASTASVESTVHAKRRKKEADEVARLLGVAYAVQVLPGKENSISQLFVGEPKYVEIEASNAFQKQWEYKIDRTYPLVLAFVGDTVQLSSWEDLARGLHVARQCVEDGGAIAICANGLPSPEEGLYELAKEYDSTSTIERIHRSRSKDAHAAWMISELREQGPLYLFSNIEEEVVESWGITPISDITELLRLSETYGDLFLIERAEYTSIIEGEEAKEP